MNPMINVAIFGMLMTIIMMMILPTHFVLTTNLIKTHMALSPPGMTAYQAHL